jgi:hypothetical protein
LFAVIDDLRPWCEEFKSFKWFNRGAPFKTSMPLIAGRTAQEYNQRKARGGTFWQDRYHATAIEADEHLHRCLGCIDLNMVRAIEYCSPFQLFKTFR